MAIQRPKGTYDLLPAGSSKAKVHEYGAHHQYLLERTRQVLERAGACRIDTPLFEEAELVKRGVGGSTDIVRKEMFTVYYFGDHGGYVLRPEGTAGIMRAYLQNGLKQLPAPLKLWTSGPMFRAENVQQGRYRQFTQVDYEVIGSTEPLVDAEAIALMVAVVRALGLKKVNVKLGSVGDAADREKYNGYLKELFGQNIDRLSNDSKERLERNPMRILDSKSASDQELIRGLQVKPMLDFLGAESGEHFEKVKQYLDSWGIQYEIDSSIVRGLDYYCRTAWELHHEGVGAKSALGGGGRYDGLAEQLGGAKTAGIGWAFGVERLLGAMEAEGIVFPEVTGPVLYLVALDNDQLDYVVNLALSLRESCHVEFAYRPLKVGNAFKYAERKNAKYVALVGSDEVQSGELGLKNLQTGEQFKVRADVAALADFLG